MSSTIDYGRLMHNAMRGLIQQVLQDVALNGLPGEHHFFITFDTRHPEAELAEWLRERYPAEMTVVIQHWFEDLEVGEDGFSVTLNFGDAPERMYIPYDSIQTFVDPSVEFGLRFETQQREVEDAEEADTDESARTIGSLPLRDREKAETAGDDEDPPRKDAEVVRLDTFRK